MGLQRRHGSSPMVQQTARQPASVGSRMVSSQSFLTSTDEQELEGALGLASDQGLGVSAGDETPPWAADPIADVLSPHLYEQATQLPLQLESAVVGAQAARKRGLQLGVDVSSLDVHIDGALATAVAIEHGLQDCEDLLLEEPFDQAFFLDVEAELVRAISVGEVALELVQAIAAVCREQDIEPAAEFVQQVAGLLWVRLTELASLAESGHKLLEQLSARFLEHQAVYETYLEHATGTVMSTFLQGLPEYFEAASSTQDLVRLSLAFSRTQLDSADPWSSMRRIRADVFALAKPVAQQLAKGSPVALMVKRLSALTSTLQLVTEMGVSAGHLALMQADIAAMERVRTEIGPAMEFVKQAGPLLGPWMASLQRYSGVAEEMEQRMALLKGKLAAAPDASFYSFTN